MITDSSHGSVTRRIIDSVPWVVLILAGLVTFWAWAETSSFRPPWGTYSYAPGLEYPVGVRQLINQRTLVASVLIVLGATLPWLFARVSLIATRQKGIAEPEHRSKRFALLVGGARVALAVIAGSVALVAAISVRDVLRPHAPEIQAIYDFEPPNGWKVDRDRSILTYSAENDSSYYPGASRLWYLSGSIAKVCLSVEQAMERWADGGSVVRQPTPDLTEDCSFDARKGSIEAEAMVFPDYGGDSDVIVQLSATGTKVHP